MPTTLDAAAARCRVFTFKEGLLSRVAHDLEIDVTRFEIEVSDDGAVVARFWPDSLRVLHALEDGRPAPRALSDKDKRKIEKNIEAEVLEVKRHPGPITFRASGASGSDGPLTIEGTLTLHGRERRLTVRARREGDALLARVRLHQPDFGITPYSAMLGALKIQPEVEVEVRVPAEPFAG